jgi:hypothetical protein
MYAAIKATKTREVVNHNALTFGIKLQINKDEDRNGKNNVHGDN